MASYSFNAENILTARAIHNGSTTQLEKIYLSNKRQNVSFPTLWWAKHSYIGSIPQMKTIDIKLMDEGEPFETINYLDGTTWEELMQVDNRIQINEEIAPSLIFISNDNQAFVIIGIDENDGFNETFSTSIVGHKEDDGSVLKNYSLICLGEI